MYTIENPWSRRARTAVLVILVLVTLFPIFWIFSTAFKGQLEMFKIPPSIVVRQPTMDNYSEAIRAGFPKAIWNSVVVGFFSTALSLLLSVPASYSFARFRFPGSRQILMIILMVKMIPGVSLILPLYKMVAKLGLINTPLALIVTYVSFQVPFAVWMLEGMFRVIPLEVEEAAILDGCSRLRAFIRVVVPLSMVGIATAAIFCFIGSWNEFMYAVTLTSTMAAKTGTVAISENISSYQIFWGRMASSATLFVLPVFLFNIFFQRFIVRGLTAGAVKA
jgi:ABC-type glycerol-3-phosphate transport system permease component